MVNDVSGGVVALALIRVLEASQILRSPSHYFLSAGQNFGPVSVSSVSNSRERWKQFT